MSNNNNNNRSNDDGRLSDIEAVSNSGLTRICTLLRSLTFENLHAQVAKESGISDPILVIALGAGLFRLSEAIWMDVRSSQDRIYVHSGKTFAELGDAVQPWSSAVSHRSSNNSNNDLASLEAKDPSATIISKVCVALKQKGSSMSVRDCEALLEDVEKGLVKEKFGGRLADLLLQSPDQLLVYDKGGKVALARSLNDWNDLVRKRLEACGGVSLMAVLINDPDVSQQIRESHGGFQKLLNRLPSFEIFGEPGGKESVRLRDGTSVPAPVQQPVPNVASASIRALEANGVLTPEKIALREWVVKFLKDHWLKGQQEAMQVEARKKLEAELEREKRKWEETSVSERVANSILWDVLPCRCPKCRERLYYSGGCFALTCDACDSPFCAFCERVFSNGSESHDHVPQCKSNTLGVHWYPNANEQQSTFARVQRERQVREVKKRLATLDENTRNEVLERIKSELETLDIKLIDF